MSCYDVVQIPTFTEDVADDTTYRHVDMSLMMNTLGRNFSLRLRFDPITGDAGGLRPEMAWSSVLSPSSVVSVIGEGGNVSKYSQDDLKITWFVGLDAFEVAPSSVLASVIDFNGHQLFRGVIRTMSDVYYVEPALQYSQVGHSETNHMMLLSHHHMPKFGLGLGLWLGFDEFFVMSSPCDEFTVTSGSICA